MKLYLIILSLAALASAVWGAPPLGLFCTCSPAPYVCASNGVTYAGECNMRCAQQWILEKLYVVHQGPCYTAPVPIGINQ